MDKMELALNDAVTQAQIAIARQRAAAGGNMPADQKRSRAWCEYGWPETVTYEMLYNLYSRGGLAFGAVDKLVGNCWKTYPQIAETTKPAATQWEKSAAQTLTPAFWRAFKEADRRRLVGRFSALLLRIADNQSWDMPATKGRLVEAVPAWAGELKAGPLNADKTSPEYGKPTRWTYKTQGVDLTVHPSRIFILGEWREGALGFLEPAYNDFVTIEKLAGGSGESFLKNAARQLNIDFDKEVKLADIAKAHGVDVKALQKVFNETAKDLNAGNDVALITQGAKVTPMTSAIPDPEPAYRITTSNISSGVDTPTRILIGNQSGERSSTEDNRYYNSRCQSRRVGDLSFDIAGCVAQLQTNRVIDAKDGFLVVWDDLAEPTAADRLENAKKLAEIAESYAATGVEAFSVAEVREAAGYDVAATPRALGEDDEA